jgi:hypothetical protein
MTAHDMAKLRAEAIAAIEADNYMLRSCWDCNPAHEHLRAATHEAVLNCFGCGRFWFRGVDVTVRPGDPEWEEDEE